MFARLGKRALLVPVVIGLVLLCVFGVALTPMMRMSIHGLQIAVVNEDAGVTLPTGELNAGELIAEQFAAMGSDEDDEDATMIIYTVESRDAVVEAMYDGEYYAAIVIPEDFSTQYVAAQSDTTGTAEITIELIVNTAKSPLVAQTIQSQLSSTLAQAGFSVEVTSIGTSSDSSNIMSGMMGSQMSVMPTIMLSIIIGVISTLILWRNRKDNTIASKAKAAGQQLVYAAVMGIVVALVVYGITAGFGGMDISGAAILYLWVVSFCLIVATFGLCDLCLPLGVLVMVCVFAFGMGTAMLPAEVLPEFWANWVVPWAPQVTIGDGMRNIIYLSGNGFEVGFGRLIGWACAGVVAAVIALFIPSRKP